MLIDELQELLDELAGANELRDDEAYAARAEALDRLELAALGLEEMASGGEDSATSSQMGQADDGDGTADSATALLQQATALQSRLLAANQALCDRLRDAIRDGSLRGPAARAALERLAANQDGHNGTPGGDAEEPGGDYDLLDSLVSDLLLDAEAPGASLPLLAEQVAYQPTPARVVLDLLDRVPLGPGDLFYDLGAGLGHVCLLVHLLTGASTRGIEIDPAYCAYARRQAAALHLTAGVEFIESDVRQADLAGGACYFLYTPFTGRTLAQALHRLADEARQRPIIVAAYGPCVPGVSRQPWLAEICGRGASELAVFRSR